MRNGLFFTVVACVSIIVIAVIFRDAFMGKHDWIDQCVIQEWEKNPPRSGNTGVRDYCVAKYRQTR
jgi:hypothetical protein